MSVVELIPNAAVAVGQEQLAQRLETLASRIRDGEFGDLERVVVLLDSAVYGVDNRTYGRPTTNMELLGLLEYAKHALLNPPHDET